LKIPSIKINVDTSAASEAIAGLMQTARFIGFLADLSTEVLEPTENAHPTKRERALQVMAASIRQALSMTDAELAEPAYAIDRERLPSNLHGQVLRGDRLVICEMPSNVRHGYSVNDVITVDSTLGRHDGPDMVHFTDGQGNSRAIFSTRLTRYID